jgi:hypothetical protein
MFIFDAFSPVAKMTPALGQSTRRKIGTAKVGRISETGDWI